MAVLAATLGECLGADLRENLHFDRQPDVAKKTCEQGPQVARAPQAVGHQRQLKAYRAVGFRF